MTKLTVTITRDAEHGGTHEGMLDAFRTLVGLGILPTKTFALTIECQDQDAQSIRDDIAVALTDRAVGIDVKIKRVIDEDIDRRRQVAVSRVPTSTPMERVWRKATLPTLEDEDELAEHAV
jgi:hypothetical protein